MLLIPSTDGTRTVTISNAYLSLSGSRTVIVFASKSRTTLRLQRISGDPLTTFTLTIGTRSMTYTTAGDDNEYDITPLIRAAAPLRQEVTFTMSEAMPPLQLYAMLANGIAITKGLIDVPNYYSQLLSDTGADTSGNVWPPQKVVLEPFRSLGLTHEATLYIGSNRLTVGGGLSYNTTYAEARIASTNPEGWCAVSLSGKHAPIKVLTPCEAFGPNASHIFVRWQWPYVIGEAPQLEANGRRLVSSVWRIDSITSDREQLSTNNLALKPSRETGEVLTYTISLNGLCDYDVWYYSRIVLSDIIYLGGESGSLPPIYRCEVLDKSIKYGISGERNGKVTVKLKVITEDVYQPSYNLDD